MTERALVYVRLPGEGNGHLGEFVGCGAYVDGGFVATCRHVWEEVGRRCGVADASEITAQIEFLGPIDSRDTGLKTLGFLLDPCLDKKPGDQDLVLLRLRERPLDVRPFQPNDDPRWEKGKASASTAILRDGIPIATQVEGDVAQTYDQVRIGGRTIAGVRRFKGANPHDYWIDEGSSGSPVFLADTPSLIGLIFLSERGANINATHLRSAHIIPGSTIAYYVTKQIAAAVPAVEAVPMAELGAILKAMGEEDVALADIPARLRAFVEAARAQADQPVLSSNVGSDIDAAITAARAQLAGLNTTSALDLIAAKVREEDEATGRRLMPLLLEQAAIQQFTYRHREAVATWRRIAELDPRAWIDFGDVQWRLGERQAALSAYERARNAAEETGDERGQSVALSRLGDVLREEGDWSAAREAYANGIVITGRLALRDPSNARWQYDHSVSHERLGDALLENGELAAARKAYESSLAIVERLTKGDPSNTEWQRGHSVSYIKLGDILEEEGHRAMAREAYATSLSIRERLTSQDADNLEWQSDLSYSHKKLGDILLGDGDRSAARDAYAVAYAITKRLASRDPDNALWQLDLSDSQEKLGDALLAGGGKGIAYELYTEALHVVERLTERDPENAAWQRMLIVLNWKIASVDSSDEARWLHKALELTLKLQGKGRLALADGWFVDELNQRLAKC